VRWGAAGDYYGCQVCGSGVLDGARVGFDWMFRRVWGSSAGKAEEELTVSLLARTLRGNA